MISNVSQEIISRLPYLPFFLFVDEISYVDNDKIIGHYTFTEKDIFYNAHFKHLPITPGVILIEMMGQIGLVSHLVFIQNLHKSNQQFHPILSYAETEFIKPIDIHDRLTVKSKKIYYRQGKIKSKMKLYNSKAELCVIFSAQLQLIID